MQNIHTHKVNKSLKKSTKKQETAGTTTTKAELYRPVSLLSPPTLEHLPRDSMAFHLALHWGGPPIPLLSMYTHEHAHI